MTRQTVALMRAGDNQARAMLLRDLHDALPRRRGLGARYGRAEARLLSQRRAVRRGRFSRVSHLDGVVGVEVLSPTGYASRRWPAARRTRSDLAAVLQLSAASSIARPASSVPSYAREQARWTSRGKSSHSEPSLTATVACGMPRSLANNGGEYQAGASPSRKRSRSAFCGRAARRPGRARRRASHQRSRWPKTDRERRRGPRLQTASDREREMGEDRRDHERCDRAQQLDDREHPLKVRGRQREARDEQCRRDCRAEADAGEARADQCRAWLGGTCTRKTAMPAARKSIPPSGRKCSALRLDRHRQEHCGDHCTGSLR